MVTYRRRKEEEYEVETVSTRIDKYRAKQSESFQSVGTVAADWEVCEIIGLISGSVPDYELPPYDEVKPFFDNLVQKIGQEPAEAYLQNLQSEGFVLCQLCGCPRVKYPCPIQCDSKRLLMYVGSECVTNFMDADEKITKQIKVYKENRLRELFDKWVYNGINQCYLYKEHGNRSLIIYEYWKFKKKLENMQNRTQLYSSIQIRNVFKKADKLGLIIPRDSILGFWEDV